MDTTLLVILLIIAFGTVMALLQARRRDKCLKDMDGFHITLAEKGGDLTWGQATVLTTGMEVEYVEPVRAKGGHDERSFIFYKDQYVAMEGLFRYPAGLPAEEQERRAAVIERTTNPGFWRRFARKLRNWINMLRDALLQAVGVVIGAAKTGSGSGAVLSSQEQGLKALSSEIIGHAGNAFDPLLERHLFEQVVVEVTREGKTRSFCGWLKDYSSDFLEILDAVAASGTPLPVTPFPPGGGPEGVDVRVEGGRLHVTNHRDQMLFLRDVAADGWRRPLHTVVPVGYTADLTLPPDADLATLQVALGTADRVDLVVPRTHALVRHSAQQRRPRR